MFLAILLFIFAAWVLLGIIGTITTVGKPRPVLTGGVAATSILVGFGMLVTLVVAGIVLMGA